MSDEDQDLIANLLTGAVAHRRDGHTWTAHIMEKAAERLRELLSEQSQSMTSGE